MGHHYKMLTGDVNWQQYGGVFYSHLKDSSLYRLYEVINMDDALGDENKGQHRYTIEYGEIELSEANPAGLETALKYSGRANDTEITDLQKVEALWSYGMGRDGWLTGNNLRELIRRTKP